MRITEQKVTYTRSDDLQILRKYYATLANIEKAIEQGGGGYSLELLKTERERITALIEAQHQILKGHEEGDDGTSQGAAERVKADC